MTVPERPLERAVGPERAAEREPMPDDETIDEVMAELEADGYDGQMAARSGARIVCFACRQESPADEFHVHALHRIEGVSDPADMMAVAALTCPGCGKQGTVVLGYGPEADPDDADALVCLGKTASRP
jgi:hypothetical protein